jgi:DNA-binding GntR family transcriptional regulator
MSQISPQAVPCSGLSPLSVRVEKDLAGQPGHFARSDGTYLWPAPRTLDRGAMTVDTLISLQSAATRIACQQMTAQHLNALHASVEQAFSLSARQDWERKATAHAELFNLLGDSTGDPVLASSATGWLHDLLMRVGPRADGIILSSRRRLLRHLRTRDADGAAREMEHHLRGLHYMGRLARGAISDSTTAAS